MSDGLYNLGLEGTDRIASNLGGGLPKGCIVLLEGENGTGKSTLAQRFSYGINQEGNTVTFISAEENSKSFIKQMSSLGYDIKSSLVNQSMLFLTADVDRKRHFNNKQLTNQQSLIESLMSSEVPFKSNLIVIDNLDEIIQNDYRFNELMNNSNGDEGMQNLCSYLSNIADSGKTIITCVNQTNLSQEMIRPLRTAATVYLKLEEAQNGLSVHVKQYKSMPAPVDDEIGFSVQPNQGVVIESRTVV